MSLSDILLDLHLRQLHMSLSDLLLDLHLRLVASPERLKRHVGDAGQEEEDRRPAQGVGPALLEEVPAKRRREHLGEGLERIGDAEDGADELVRGRLGELVGCGRDGCKIVL